jgi:putative membrane protein
LAFVQARIANRSSGRPGPVDRPASVLAEQVRTSPVREVNGVLAGLVAAALKAFSEPRLQAAAERLLPPSAAQKQAVGADPTGRPENMPPAVLADRVAVALGHERLSIPQRLRVQNTIHYAFGAGAGVAYFAAARRWSAMSRGGGALAGLALYAATHGSLLPALGIQPWPWRLAPAALGWESSSHILFGVALETARRELRRRP